MNEAELFWNTYHALAKDGVCDSPGGYEYRRVFAEWIKAGKPNNVEQFIRKRAGWVPRLDMLASTNGPH
jgi:hypothetical protein